MKKTARRLLSLLMTLLLAFGTLSLCASAANVENIYLQDVLKVSTDPANNKLYILDISFNRHFRNFNEALPIQLLDKKGNIVATGEPQHGDEFITKFYAYPSHDYGVTLDPGKMYTIYIQEGTFVSTTTGYLGAACSKKMDGATLTGNDRNYTIKNLGITSYLSTGFDGGDATKVKKGKITFDRDFTAIDSWQFDMPTEQRTTTGGEVVTALLGKPENHGVRIEKKTTVNGSTVWVTVAYATVSRLDSGSAEFEFWSFREVEVPDGDVNVKALARVDGVSIDKYAQYRVNADYGSFYNAEEKIFCADGSTFEVTGKKLLGLSEKYPFIDILIELFGKDNFLITAILFVLEYVGKISPDVDALWKDLKAYIAAK